MPKNRILEKETWVSSKDRKGNFQIPKLLDLKLNWEGKDIKDIKSKILINLADVYDLQISRDEALEACKRYFSTTSKYNHMRGNLENWQIELKTKSGFKGSSKRDCLLMGYKSGEHLAEDEVETFNNWVYWILVSSLQHSKHKIIDKIVDRVEGKWKDEDRRKRKIQTRIYRRGFDTHHKLFVSLIEDADKKRKKLPKRGEKTLKGENGMKFSGKLDFKLGSGTFSTVYKINRKKGKETEPVAVKRIKPSVSWRTWKDTAPEGVKEARIHASLGNHPNIIKLLDVAATKDCLFLFMEKGRTLGKMFDELKKYNSKNLVRYAEDILKGVSHMHSRGIYHLDLKPENILIVNNVAKIADFGSAHSKADYKKYGKIYKDISETLIGSKGYIPHDDPPPKKGEDLEKRDAYAIGMIFLRCFISPKCDVEFDAKRYADYRFWGRHEFNHTYEPPGPHEFLKKYVGTFEFHELNWLVDLTKKMIAKSVHRITPKSALKKLKINRHRLKIDRHRRKQYIGPFNTVIK